MTARKTVFYIFLFGLTNFVIGQADEYSKTGGQSNSELRHTSVFTEYADSVFGQTFENRPLDSEYHENDMISDFSIGDQKPIAYTTGLGTYDGDTQWKIDALIGTYNADIIDVPALQNGIGEKTRCVRIIHRQGKYGILGSNNGNGSGAVWSPRIPAGHKELYFSYNVMRDEGALPLREAKMPCLMGSFTYGDNNIGFRANSIMNRQEEFAQKWLVTLIDTKEVGGYWNDPETGNRWKWDWTDSTWYNITFRISVNDPGQANGILEVFINGKLSNSMSGLEMMSKDFYIDRMQVHWFHGGNTEDYALSRDAPLYLDDFYLFTYKEGYAPGPREKSPPGRVLYRLPNWDIEQGKKKEPGDAEAYDDTPPTSPENLRVTGVTKYSIDIAWDASSDFAGIRSYSIFVNDQKAFESQVPYFNIGGLEADTEYKIYVKATDLSGNVSTKSNVLTQRTKAESVPPPPPPPPLTEDTIAPTPPSNLEAKFVSDRTIQVSWEPATDDYGIYYYSIFVDDKEIYTTPDTFMTVGFLDSSEEPIEIYVVAYDINGNVSAPSETLVYILDAADSEAPTPPLNLRSTYVSENTISLEWDPSNDNQGVKEYLIYVNDKYWESSSRSEETVANLESGLPYKIHVTAVDDAGNISDRSNTIEVTTKNSDETIDPTFPEISIIEMLQEVHVPQVTSEMSSLGFIELESFGLEVVETQDLSKGSKILNGLGSTKVINSERTTSGLQAFYNFTEGDESNIIIDHSGLTPPMNLFIEREGLATEWLPGQGLRIQDETYLSYLGDNHRLIDSLRSTNEITIEIWLKQEELHQQDDAHIFALAGPNDTIAASLTQASSYVYYNYSAKLNTSEFPLGNPALNTGYNFTSLSLHHVVYTRNNVGEERIYINGIELAVGNRSGDFSSWDDFYELVFCNHPDGEQYWLGILYMLAVYNRALDQEEITQNFKSQAGKIQFTNELSELETDVEYQLTPFIVSSQGLVYGKPRIFQRKTVTQADSLFSFYPNPNNGEFRLQIFNKEEDLELAKLRIADYSGVTHYIQEIELTGLLMQEEWISLPANLPGGEYVLSVIAGNQAFSNKMILQR